MQVHEAQITRHAVSGIGIVDLLTGRDRRWIDNQAEPAMNPSARRNQPGPGPEVQLPKGGFEHPFHISEDSEDDDVTPIGYEATEGLKERPRIVSGLGSPLRRKFVISPPQFAELRMCALSNSIREKPNWWEEMKNGATVKKWREGALQEWEETSRKLIDVWRDSGASTRRLTPTMVK